MTHRIPVGQSPRTSAELSFLRPFGGPPTDVSEEPHESMKPPPVGVPLPFAADVRLGELVGSVLPRHVFGGSLWWHETSAPPQTPPSDVQDRREHVRRAKGQRGRTARAPRTRVGPPAYLSVPRARVSGCTWWLALRGEPSLGPNGRVVLVGGPISRRLGIGN